MTTPRKILQECGFKKLANDLQSSYGYTRYGYHDGKKRIATAGVEEGSSHRSWDVYVNVGNKRRRITLNDKPMTEEQQVKFRTMLQEAIQLGIMRETQPKAPVTPRVAMTLEQLRDRKILIMLGKVYICTFTKDVRSDSAYIRTPKAIRIEDGSFRLAYASVTEGVLKEFGIDMTLDQLETWLQSHNINRKKAHRRTKAQIRASMPLYD